jgi:hypothetical protein
MAIQNFLQLPLPLPLQLQLQLQPRSHLHLHNLQVLITKLNQKFSHSQPILPTNQFQAHLARLDEG